MNSEFKAGKCAVEEGIHSHYQHTRTKNRIALQKEYQVGRSAIVESVYIQIFKMQKGSHIVVLRVQTQL